MRGTTGSPKPPQDPTEEGLQGIGTGQVQHHPPNTGHHPGRDLEELQPNGVHLGGFQLRVLQRGPPEVLDQEVGGGTEQQAELICLESRGSSPGRQRA